MSAVWRIPTLLGTVSLVGLASAIFGDGLWDWVCWAGLGIPLAVCLVKLRRQWPAPRV